jgi:Tol biopolymer transport system component
VLLGLLGRSVLTGTGAPPPADERIVFSAPEPDGNRSISVINADGSGLTKLTDGTSYDVFPSWSPDGSQIAFVSDRDGRQPGSESHQDVYVMNADGSNVRRLTDAKGRDICPAWSPDGSTIAFVSAREQTGRPITYLMNPDGSNQRRLRAGESGCAKWSPDGSRLLFGYSEPGGSRLATIRPDGTGETLIASGQVGGPVWSPDGTQIAFDRHDGIVLLNADGSNDRFLTVGSFPDWSPDGERIAYTSYLSGRGQIHSIRRDGSQDVRLSSVGAPGYMPLWSPSSSQLAFLRGASGDTRIVVVNADGTREIEVARGSDPEWQP